MPTLDPIIVNPPKKQITQPLTVKDVQCIAKQVYFDSFGTNKVVVEIDGEYRTIQDFALLCANAGASDIGKSVKISNLIPGATIELKLVALDHYDLANGRGKAHTVWQSFTILNEYTYLGLPWDTVDNDNDTAYSTNKGGYPTALGLIEQLEAIYNAFPKAFKDLIKTVEIPCYLPGYEIGDAKYINNIFVPSATEVGFSNETDQNVPEDGDGTKYDYYEEGNGDDALALRLTKFLDGSGGYYWTRTPYLSAPDSWYSVSDSGTVDYDTTVAYYGVAFAICI